MPQGVNVIRVLIADDQALVRDGLRALVELEDDLSVVGEATDGNSAVRLALHLRPVVGLMDVRMPGLDGIEATQRLTSGARPPKILVLTMFNQDEFVLRALRAGASGFLLKDVRGGQLTRAIRTVHAGDQLVDASITRRLVEERFADAPAADPARAARLRTLTGRELDVLKLIARGRSNAEIAEELVLGEATVKTHVGRILAKLELRDRVQAVVAAYESGLVTAATGPSIEESPTSSDPRRIG
jgi:DNA-binding NarL/FixJ family response regulator